MKSLLIIQIMGIGLFTNSSKRMVTISEKIEFSNIWES